MESFFLKNLTLFDGQVFLPDHCSLWINQGKIEDVYWEHDIPRSVPSHTVILDLEGKTVLPTFIESHCHFLATAMAEYSVNMRTMTAVTDLAPVLQKMDNELPQEEWIYGSGWHLELKEMNRLNAAFLDSVVPDRPVMLESRDYHAVWLNSAAIEYMGLSTHPWKNQVGILWENERQIAYDRSRKPSASRVAKMASQLLNQFLSVGITGAVCMDFQRDFEILYPILPRLNTSFEFSWFAPVQFLPKFLAAGIQKGDTYHHMKVAGIKLFMDGAFGSRTAHLSTPYHGTDNFGESLIDDETLYRTIKQANTNGLPVAIHAIGDHAILRAVEALRKNGDPSMPNRLEHVQLPDEYSLDEISTLKVAVAVQPCHITDDIPMIQHLLPDRRNSCYPFRKMLDRHIPLLLSSDAPVADFNPWRNIYAAVTHGSEDNPLNPTQKLSFTEAIKSTTMTGRNYGALRPNGMIQKGAPATFQIVNQTLHPHMKPKEILEIETEFTFIDGQIQYQKEAV